MMVTILKRQKFTILFLGLLLIASFAIRLYKLGSIPNGLSTDEADMGYNAYSIIKTGKDVYGKSYPLFFQALDDYKPGLVFYSTIPAISIFGLNDFAIRLTPAILGSLIPLLIYWFVSQLYLRNKKLAYLSAILSALAPWSIHISRAMIWYVEMLFFYLLFINTFIYSLKNNSKFALFSSLFLATTLYIYYASFLYLPLTIILLSVIYKKIIFKSLKVYLLSLIALSMLSIPAIINYQNQAGRTRFNAISVLTPDITLPTSISEMTYDAGNDIPFSTVIHNRRFVYTSDLIKNYVSYFNFDYLFVNSNSVRYFYVNNVGLFYLLELPFALYGIYVVTRRREKSDLLLLGLLLIAPIPAMITLGTGFIHRALLLLPTIQIISTIGAISIFSYLAKYKKVLIIPLIIVYGSTVFFFLHQYLIHSEKEFTSENDNGAWFSTVKETIPLVNHYRGKYDKVVFTWSSGKLVPAVYFLFYNQVDPRILQAKTARWTNEPPSYKQIYNQIDNIQFRPINWETDKNLKNTLFVGYPKEFGSDAKVIDQTFLPNGNRHFLLVESQ